MKTPDFWRQPSLLGYLLMPLSWLYRLAAEAALSHHKPRKAALPVLSIGNATAGGAGKTPAALALLPLLTALGARACFITRGYQSATPLRAHAVTGDDPWETVGDEALLLAQAAPTWVGRERLASIAAAAQAGHTLAICDDALQHHPLKKDVSLLVIDGPYGLGNGQLLPAGPLRETLGSALSRCDAVIMIGEDRQQLGPRLRLPVFYATLTPQLNRDTIRAQSWIAFAGIGRPEKFFTTLRELGAVLMATHAFPDHHAYMADEITTLLAEAERTGARLITTAKDAVKLTADQRARITVLPVILTFEQPEAVQEFLKNAFLPTYTP